MGNKGTEAVAAAAPKSMDAKPLPAFEGQLMDGGTLSTDDMKGEVVYLSFFASWCGPCRKELPELAMLQEKYKDRKFRVVGVGVDAGAGGARKSEAMARKYGADAYDVILDPQNKVLGLFDVKSMPTTYIIDRNGVIQHKQVGFGDTTVEKVTPIIEGLL